MNENGDLTFDAIPAAYLKAPLLPGDEVDLDDVVDVSGSWEYLDDSSGDPEFRVEVERTPSFPGGSLSIYLDDSSPPELYLLLSGVDDVRLSFQRDD